MTEDTAIEQEEDDTAPFFDRDHSETFEIELEWWQWTKLWCLASQGIDKKEEDDWPEEELERDRELKREVSNKIDEANPGNGIDDWPESMREAYNEAMAEGIREMIENER